MEHHTLNKQGSLPERILDVDVPVQGNCTQIEYASRGTHDVKGDPCVTESRPEDPVAQ